jgi:uncharacterized membrane protein YkvA (DUF1232 family)
MPLTVTLEISDAELEHFRSILERARARTGRRDPVETIDAVRRTIGRLRERRASPFVTTRLERVEALIGMLEDPEWQLPEPNRRRVLDGLAYVADSHDLVPDSVPALGLVDDAIMLELVLRELRHELDGYEEFVTFRREAQGRPGGALHTPVSRDDWLMSKRRALLDRIDARRERDIAQQGGELSLITHL